VLTRCVIRAVSFAMVTAGCAIAVSGCGTARVVGTTRIDRIRAAVAATEHDTGMRVRHTTCFEEGSPRESSCSMTLQATRGHEERHVTARIAPGGRVVVEQSASPVLHQQRPSSPLFSGGPRPPNGKSYEEKTLRQPDVVTTK
jgi:hypothetical protein